MREKGGSLMELNIGVKFKKARKNLKLNQKEVSQIVNISKNYYSNIERGIQVPKLETFILIANTLNVPDILDEYLLPNTTAYKEIFQTTELDGLTHEEFDLIKNTITIMASNFKKTRSN